MSKGFCCIGLFNPKTPENVGSVLRAAGCYGVNTVFYTGVRYDRAKEFVTDTKKVHQKIPLIGIEDLKQVIPLGCTPVAIELVKGAKPGVIAEDLGVSSEVVRTRKSRAVRKLVERVTALSRSTAQLHSVDS